MTFTVTYRGAKGAPVTEAVEAADRAECLAQLKKRGIAPTSVKEGGAKQDKKAVGDRAKPNGGNSVAYVLLAVCVILVALGGIWLFGRGKEQPSQDGEVVRKRSALAKEVTPAKAAKPNHTGEKTNKVARTKKEPDTAHYREEFHTNMYGYVINPPSSSIVYTNGPDQACMSLGEKVFKNTAEQKIADLLTMEPGEMLVGDSSSLYGRGFARQLVKAAENPAPIDADDSDEVKELKMAVREATLDLKKRMDAGEDISATMKSLRDEMQNIALYRHDLEKELSIIAKREDITEADLVDFVKAANQLLSERGAKPLTMPRFAARRLMRLQKRNVK